MQFVLHWIKIKLYAIFLHVGHENLVLNAEKVLLPFLCLLKPSSPTTAHLWYDSHSTNINACRMWRVRTKVQISRNKLHTKFLSYIKKKKKNMFSYHQESLYSFLNKEKAAIMKHLTASTHAFHEGISG